MTKITELNVKKLKPGTRVTDRGLVARCLPSGEVTFGYQYTDKASGKRRWMGIGVHGNITVAVAYELAKKYAGKVAGREDPAAAFKTATARSENTVNHVLNRYLEIRGRKMRSAHTIMLNLDNHVRPVLGNKVIYDLTRGDVMKLIDTIGKDYPRMAGIVHAYLRAAFNFWMLRDEAFKTPIIKGMVKDKTKVRHRVLTPDELRDIWRALETIEHVPDCFAAYVKVLLLSGCRRREVAHMHTNEIMGDRWIIPAARYKTKVNHTVPLIPAIKKLLPKCKDGFVFSSDGGKTALDGFGKPKSELDAAIAAIRRREKRAPMAGWVFHDTRRTARTMLAELGVTRETAEAVLGHAVGGIERHYNMHKYENEKREALIKLADHVDDITRAPAPAAKMRLVAGR
jgi:integrase